MATYLTTTTTTTRHHPLFSTHLRRSLRPPPKAIAISTSEDGVKSYRAAIQADIDAHILNSLPTNPPPAITDPVRHLVTSTPMSIAPSLCVAACELVGGNRHHAVATASALHLMHAAAHTHGSLPALLSPTSPRRRPRQFSLGVELMAGDGILPLGYEVVVGGGGDPERLLRVIVEIVEAMGPQGVLKGMLMEAEGKEEEAAVKKKEGRLAACGAACGAILGGASEEAVERLRRCGMYAGMMHGLLCSRRRGSADGYRSLARSELGGFEENMAAGLRDLLDLWFQEEATATDGTPSV